MSEIAQRYRKVADGFTQRVRAVPKDGWDAPAPCEGWVARDVVRHMVEWMPGFFLGNADVAVPEIPSVDTDPAGAWEVLSTAIQGVLDDADTASREFEMRVGRYSVERAVDRFGTDDILIHTWDLARATGLDETLDTDEVRVVLGRLQEVDEELLRGSGQFGPRVDVPEDADDQTKLIAYTGRRP